MASKFRSWSASAVSRRAAENGTACRTGRQLSLRNCARMMVQHYVFVQASNGARQANYEDDVRDGRVAGQERPALRGGPQAGCCTAQEGSQEQGGGVGGLDR